MVRSVGGRKNQRSRTSTRLKIENGNCEQVAESGADISSDVDVSKDQMIGPTAKRFRPSFRANKGSTSSVDISSDRRLGKALCRKLEDEVVEPKSIREKPTGPLNKLDGGSVGGFAAGINIASDSILLKPVSECSRPDVPNEIVSIFEADSAISGSASPIVQDGCSIKDFVQEPVSEFPRFSAMSSQNAHRFENESSIACNTSSVSPLVEDVFTRYKDLDYFLDLVELELSSTDSGSRLESWKLIYEKGIRECYDWAEHPCENLDQMWTEIVYQAKKLRQTTPAVISTGVRSGMRREAYEEIYRFLKTGEYPEKIDCDRKNRRNFIAKCAEYSINSSDQIEYNWKGSRRVVLLEGEVEAVVRHVHSALAHSTYYVTSFVVSSHFHTSCTMHELAKTLIGGCKTKCNRIATNKNYKSVRIKFERRPLLHIEVFLNDKICQCSELQCDMEHLETIARLGISVSIYEGICAALNDQDNCDYIRYSKLYQLDSHFGLMTIKGKIVLDDAIGADVAMQIHNIYGHITSEYLKKLVLGRFECSGISNFCGGIRSFCSFCSLRPGGRRYATPAAVYQNAKYDVRTDWKNGKRKITIIPIGLNQELIDEYVKKVLRKYDGNLEDMNVQQVSLASSPELLPIHHKILRLSSEVDCSQKRTASPVHEVQRKSLLKRRMKEEGATSHNRSVHWPQETKSACDPVNMVDTNSFNNECDSGLDCFSDDEGDVVPNISWLDSFERYHHRTSEITVPQMSPAIEQPTEHMNYFDSKWELDRITQNTDSPACVSQPICFLEEDTHCSSDIRDDSSVNEYQDSFIELKPVGPLGVNSPIGDGKSIEELFLQHDTYDYTSPTYEEFPQQLADPVEPSLGQIYSDAMQAIFDANYI